jgi:dihydrofolate reductase
VPNTDGQWRKLILFNMVTLDGFFEGPQGDLSWHNVDEEFNAFALDQLRAMGAIVFGRVTYEGMASYWPTPLAAQDDPAVADFMNQMPKIVFSRTLAKVEWNNSTLLKGDLAAELSRLKQQPGKDLILFGSANLAGSLTRLRLIDEYRLMMAPVVIGSGTPMFQNGDETLKLTLLESRPFLSGNVLLRYAPAPAAQ